MGLRKEYQDKLHANDLFKKSLDKARNQQERDAIQAFVDEFVGSFVDVLEPIIEQAKSDPAFAKKLGLALNEGKDVVTDSEPETSGSTG